MLKDSSKRTGGELLAETLKLAGVDKIFALHGGHLEGLLKACSEQSIELIDFRHESAAGHAADSYARMSGKLGVCVITAGPGFTNAISAIANAKLDSSPVLFIIGAQPLRELETNALQGGIDQIAMAKPAAKWALSITTTERIPDLTAMAIRKARAGTPGPVVLELPIDILHMSAPKERATPPAGLNVLPRPAPSPQETETLATLVAKADQPVFIADCEAGNPSTADALAKLCEASGVPVFYTQQGQGVLPADHSCNLGAAGTLAAMSLTGGPQPDLIVLLGGKLGLLLGGRSGAVINDSAKLVQVHSDATEIGRIRTPDLAISADVAETVRALTDALKSTTCRSFEAYKEAVKSTIDLMAQQFERPDDETNGVHPYFAAREVCAAAGQDAVYVFDGGEANSWGGDCAVVDGPNQVLGHGYLGCLGTGPGFAIGAQYAHPQKRVVHLTGDGAMGFHIQEFDTMVRHGLPIVTCVLNNRVWGISLHGQQMMYGEDYSMITHIGGTNYADIAGAFVAYSERVTSMDEIAPAMQRALSSGKPALLEIMTDPAIVHPLTVSMLGEVEEGSSEVMVPYYENIPSEGA